jgi:uncharacterized membrane protein
MDDAQTLVSPRSVPVLSRSGGPAAPAAPPASDDMLDFTDQFTAVRLPGPGHQPPLPVNVPVNGSPSQPVVEEMVDVEYPNFDEDETFPRASGASTGQSAGGVSTPQSWPLPHDVQSPPDDTVELPGGAVAAAGAAGALAAASRPVPATPLHAAQSVPPISPTPVSPGTPSHVPWEASHSWGTTTITFSANTAAGLSYLFGWLSGIFFYFGEHHNRYVRFHAMQSILLTGILTAVGAVTAAVVWLLLLANQAALTLLGVFLAVIVGTLILAAWLGPMVAAFMGHYLLLPFIGRSAERWSSPVQEPFTP